ncbi:hypothetical protein PVAND_015261 [Polypedilum vanderplanki]|uniref:Otopetrin n=1 Tax=Polypedilum vanderplanki TaxID=319348 RepID=A0A9J6BC45_POLVA|nr:hypothetical protein PVAND_015261 [Polypedilum vanderplanki]
MLDILNENNQLPNLHHQQAINLDFQCQSHDEKNNEGSTTKEKIKMTRQFSTTIFAICYAMFLTMFSAIVFVSDAVNSQRPIPQIFCIFMLTVGFCYFIYLYIDIRIHSTRVKKSIFEREERIKEYERQILRVDENRNSQLQRQTSFSPTSNQFPSIPHNYCFVTGRHGELLYLKIGATFFCFGLLVHSFLSLAYNIPHIFNGTDCQDLLKVIVDFMFPVYSLLMLFFIFKYCSVVINTKQWLARIMLMHAIGTQLGFWILTIVTETTDAIISKRIKNELKNKSEIATTLPTFTTEIFEETSEGPLGLNSLSTDCPGPLEIKQLYRNLEPYLYPFIIEYCILSVGIFYMIWSNINKCPKREFLKVRKSSDSSMAIVALTDAARNSFELKHETQYSSSFVVHADCHAASRGLFAGLILMIIKIVLIIISHITVTLPDYTAAGLIVDRSFEFAILLIMIITTILAYCQTSKLDVNKHSISKLDDVLLLIAVPAFFSESIFSFVPAIYNGSVVNILCIVAQLTQILIQTPWIIDALRRCSNTKETRRIKPGKALVTFLTIANVALWIYYTFSVKSPEIIDERYEFYGDRLWSILNHLSLPLIMFYRFHSSVCLVDIWKHSYEKSE